MPKCHWSKFELQDFGTWPFVVKGDQLRIFLDNGYLASERVPVFTVQLVISWSLVLWEWEWGWILIPSTAGGQSSLLCMLQRHDPQPWFAIFEKLFSTSSSRIEPF